MSKSNQDAHPADEAEQPKSAPRAEARSAPARPARKNLRVELAEFVEDFYQMLGFTVRTTRDADHRNTLVQIFAKGASTPEFKYVFDRRAQRAHPEAELFTFNSPPFNEMLATVGEKGQITKGFIPFEMELAGAFETAMRTNLETVGEPNRGFLVNATMEVGSPHVGYLPFVLLLLRLTLQSVESHAFLEKLVIPVVDPARRPQSVDVFSAQIHRYFSEGDPRVSTEMPLEGELRPIEESSVVAAVETGQQQVRTAVEARQRELAALMDVRLQKELKILHKYYEARVEEIENRIARYRDKLLEPGRTAAYKKKRKKQIAGLEEDLERYRAEAEQKTAEYQGTYAVDVEAEVVGAAAIYFPADFYFPTTFTTKTGTVDYAFYYDVLEHALLLPECGCGRPVHQGVVCDNHHVAHEECSARCKECQALVCPQCGARECRVCHETVCATHAHACDRCTSNLAENPWTCADHLAECSACGLQVCSHCATACKVCGEVVCRFDEACSLQCAACKEHVCRQHVVACPICNEPVCVECLERCTTCHQRVGRPHLQDGVCTTCRGLAREKFAQFYHSRTNRAVFRVPRCVPLKPTPATVEKTFTDPRGRHAVTIPKNLAKVAFNDNHRFQVFRFATLTRDFYLVRDTQTLREVVYTQLKLLGKLKQLVTRERPNLEVEVSPASQPERNPYGPPPEQLKPEPGGTDDAPGVESSTSTGEKACPQCHKTFPAQYQLCPFCGTALTDTAGSAGADAAEPPENTKQPRSGSAPEDA